MLLSPLPTALTSPTLTPLPDVGVITAKGRDARAFLQGQLTNDAAAVGPALAQLTGYCSPKGRLLALATLCETAPDQFCLLLPRELLSATLKRLRMFVLRSQLTLADELDIHVASAVGAAAIERLRQQGFAIDDAHWSVASSGTVRAITQPGPVPRVHLLGAGPALAAITEALALPTAPPGVEAALDILAGRPTVLAATSDQFVPQMIDLDRCGGVSFTKGCYPGQEIVARVHYLGRVKQRLFRARAAESLPPGAALVTADGGRPAGLVVASAPHPENHGSLALLSLQLETADQALQLEASGTSVFDVSRVNAD